MDHGPRHCRAPWLDLGDKRGPGFRFVPEGDRIDTPQQLSESLCNRTCNCRTRSSSGCASCPATGKEASKQRSQLQRLYRHLAELDRALAGRGDRAKFLTSALAAYSVGQRRPRSRPLVTPYWVAIFFPLCLFGLHRRTYPRQGRKHRGCQPNWPQIPLSTVHLRQPVCIQLLIAGCEGPALIFCTAPYLLLHRYVRGALWSRHSRRIVPISLSTYGFCHGDREAVGLSRMPIARKRCLKIGP